MLSAVAGVLVTVVVFCWLLRAAYLSTLAGQFCDLPPDWRLPEIPAGARVVSDSMAGGSGGCWREITLQGSPGQSAEELASEMGLPLHEGFEDDEWGRHVLDPAPVWYQVTAGPDLLRVSFGYPGRGY